MTADAPFTMAPVDYAGMDSGGTLLDAFSPDYTPEWAFDDAGNAVSGNVIPDTGTPGLTSEVSWWDKLTAGSQSTNVLKAALGVGGMSQYYAGKKAASSQRQVGALNAQVLENEAQFQLQKGQIESAAYKKKYQALMGKQRASYGASGVKSTEGSPLMVLEDTYDAMNYDAAIIKWGSEVAATKVRNQIPGATMEAELAARKSESAGLDSLLTAGGRYWQLNG